MKIIYETDPAPKTLTFADVEENQFFVDDAGRLCQKITNSVYSAIANSCGEPYGDHYSNVRPQMEISRIIPKIAKIEF